MHTDAELVARYLAGSQDAADTLVRRHGPTVFRLLGAMLGNAADAEDLAQDTFSKAFVHLASFDRARSFEAWILTIARNAAIDFWRKRGGLPEGHVLPGASPEVIGEDEPPRLGRGDGPGPEHEEDRVRAAKEFARCVRRRMMDWLCRYTGAARTPRLRRGMLMYLRGCSHGEIARRCQYVSADAARITMYKAVRRALDQDPAARDEASRIVADTRAQYRLLGVRPSGAVRLLNLLELPRE